MAATTIGGSKFRIRLAPVPFRLWLAFSMRPTTRAPGFKGELRGKVDENKQRLDGVRKRSSELDNHLIDEYAAGRISRRAFIRRGTVMGMSIPLLSFIAAACGGTETPSSGGNAPNTAKPQAGGALRTGIGVQAGALDPVTRPPGNCFVRKSVV